jgi:prevent-host-death family protein
MSVPLNEGIIMQNINISDFRANLLSYLQKAHDGEELTVTSHGEVLATIIPPIDKREKARKALNALSKTAIINDIVSPTKNEWKATK